MDLGVSERVKPLLNDVIAFIEEVVVPNEKVYRNPSAAQG